MQEHKKKKIDSIFIGFSDIGGYYQLLAKGLHELGYNVTLFHENESKKSPEYYPKSKDLRIMKMLIFFKKKYIINKIFIFKLIFFIAVETCKFFLFIWAIRKHDTFVFGFSKTFFLGNFDLIILRKLNKQIISNIGHGSESRPPYLDGGYLGIKNKFYYQRVLFLQSFFKKRKIKRIENYSNFIISSPHVSHFNTKSFINWMNLGLPINIDLLDASNIISNNSNIIRILHAPSLKSAKGTYFVRKAINNLINSGIEIKFIELSNKPHKLVLQEIKKCDFVIDQVFSDILMAAFPLEAASFGKPAIVSGYKLGAINNYYNNNPPPVMSCEPKNLEATIKKLIMDKDLRERLGREAQDYVLKNWNYKKMAKSYQSIMNNSFPKSWLIDPYKVFYFHGWGMKKDTLTENLRDYIRKFGKSSLRLEHNKKLEQFFIDFIKN